MGKIVILPDIVCNQIAAGEVVERPSAVVKELMENSIDAGGRRISVHVLQGGRKEIRVADTGTGMSSEDALLALERHATSKIRAAEDLQAISSLGFRGEALPSIAAVSRFELVTRDGDSMCGVKIRVEGGVLRDVRETGCPVGTMITVRDLFFNLPARRKFLRSVDTEMSHVSDHFLRLALAHPGIHLQLFQEERLQYDFLPSGNLEERAAQVLGPDSVRKLRPFSGSGASLSVRGLAGVPELRRANTHSLFVFVNGRPVWERTLTRAVLSAYDTMLPAGRYPVTVLFVDLPPGLVDVNVHPTKREVRFRNPGEVLETVRNVIREALVNRSSVMDAGKGTSWPVAPESLWTRRQYHSMERQSRIEGSLVGQPDVSANVSQSMRAEGSPEPLDSGEAGGEEHGRDRFPSAPLRHPFSSLHVLGQLANTYILLESPDGLVLIDQHAAHERILYEELSAKSPSAGGQRLTHPVVLHLLPREAAVLRRWLPQLEEAGFGVEPFGQDSFLVHTAPSVLGPCRPDELLREFLSTTQEEEKTARWDFPAVLAKTAACHGSVRAGQRLTPQEIRHLLETLDRMKIPPTCPHGRPIWHKLTLPEIARFFRRT
ncbi:MAG: DNA mismatch repair endonuclease MutL [Syntrophobacteraceae bacterium]|nr:DNA mismatch repair endonuclease MutL [Syntrophobacteraceae bacterium]